MNRVEVEFTNLLNFKLKKIDGLVEGLSQRVISGDPGKGDYTRILNFAPGTDTSPNGIQIHDFWKELYIIDGSLIDLTLNIEFTKGMVASRPPGMKHGPWISPNGCTMFEVSYYK